MTIARSVESGKYVDIACDDEGRIILGSAFISSSEGNIIHKPSANLSNGQSAVLNSVDGTGFASIAIACAASGSTMTFVIEASLDGSSSWVNLSEGNQTYSLGVGNSEMYRDNNCHALAAVRVRVTSGTGTLAVTMNGGR